MALSSAPVIPLSWRWHLRYIDSGGRDPGHAVATWLYAVLQPDVAEVRVQSGFYSREVLPPFIGPFTALAAPDALVRVVVGSNDGGTLASHLDELVAALHLPRANAHLGVVYFAGAFFHPKTYHFRRTDGSQAAYVGSANFTLSGIAKHVEAGITLDTRDGDPPHILDEIAAATDAWFNPGRAGLEVVNDLADVQRLLANGIVRANPAPRAPRPTGQGGQAPQRPGLAPLVIINPPANAAAAPAVAGAGPAWTPLPTEQRTPPYPPYVWFAQGATAPTRGPDALTGTGLGDATGLIIRLSRDNDRHWRDAPGTANISIPVSTAPTLRFGVYGNRNRPRAEFDFLARYVDDGSDLRAPPAETGIMSFGSTPGDVGHADLRLVLPKPPIADLRGQLIARGTALPQALDLAVLEWPTPATPSFRLTFVDPGSQLGASITTIWQSAVATNQLASRGACWLPVGVSPAW